MRRLLPLLLMLGGCTVGPNYHAPDVKPLAGDRFAEAPAETIAPALPVDLQRWWQAFGDPELDRLVALALRDNPDILTAASRIRQARYQVTSARSAELPQVNAAAQGSRSTITHGKATIDADKLLGGVAAPSGITLPTGKQKLPVGGNVIRQDQAGFDATWEIDLFGGVRRQVEAARAQEQAAEYNAADAAVSLSAEVANDYLALRLAQQRFHVAQAEIARQSRSLQILQETAQVGLVPQTNFTRQRTQLATAQAALPPLVTQAKTQLHALAILTARPPAELEVEIATERPLAIAPAVPPGLPSELLRRRPDIRAAERQLAAATAEIGVSVADLYPRLTLTGAVNFISDALGSLASLHGIQGQGAAAATFPILDWGRRRATVGIREEAREQAYQSYKQTVLGALGDTEDALARLDGDRSRLVVLKAGIVDAERSVRSTQNQFRVGLTDFDAVLNAQASVLQLSDQFAQAQGQQRQDLVSLYKALGGGWDPDHPAAGLSPDTPHLKKD